MFIWTEFSTISAKTYNVLKGMQDVRTLLDNLVQKREYHRVGEFDFLLFRK